MPEKIEIPRPATISDNTTGKTASLESVLEGVRVDDVYKSIAGVILGEVEKRLREKEKELFKKIPDNIKEVIAGDMFYAMFKYNPRLKDKKELSNELQAILAEFLEKLMKTKRYKLLHRITRLNRKLSLVFSVRFTKSFIASLLKEDQETLENLVKALQEASKCKGGGNNQSSTQAQSQAGNTTSTASQGQRPGKSGAGATSGMDEEVKKALMKAMEKAVKEASTATEATEMIPGLGQGFEPGDLAFVDDDLGVSLVELSRILKILDGIKTHIPVLTKKYRKKSRTGFSEGYTLTSKPDKALPRELTLPEELFMAKLASGRFLTWEKKEPTSTVFIVLLDKSNSMEGYKIAWAKAVAYALAIKAKRMNSDWILIPFDTSPYNPVALEEAYKALKIKASGGTNIGEALVEALKYAIKNGYEKANIIVITDGIDDVIDRYKESVLRLARKIKSTIRVVFIGKPSDYRRNESLIEIVEATRGEVMMTTPSEDGALKVIKSV